MRAQCLSQLRQVGLNHIPDDGNINPEVLVHKDVAETSDLRPRDLRVRTNDLRREVVQSFANDLQVALNRILGHLNDVRVAVKRHHIALASFDGLQCISDALLRCTTHSATASASAESDAGLLSSWTGKMSTSSRPNSNRVSSISPEARINRFPSAGSISTTMSMSEPGDAVPRATEPNSLGFVARYLSRSAWNSSRRASMSSRKDERLARHDRFRHELTIPRSARCLRKAATR